MAVKDLTLANLVSSAYQRGQSMDQIARTLGISVVRVSRILRESGGRPRRRPGNPPPTNVHASD